MPRRGHKKSRAGCAECKRRHVKCDETHPACVNCKVASLKCSYKRPAPSLAPPANALEETPAYSPLTPDAGSTATGGRDVSSNSSLSGDLVNMDHLELLHHFESITYQSFSSGDSLALLFRDTAITHGFRFPFLMYAILALSAMHLCRLRSEQYDHYHSLATSLQATGLSALKDTLLNVNEDNCIAAFLFTTITGMHSFCDTFSFRGGNFNQFLDQLTNSIRLMRGVRSVMDGRWWDYLRTTQLAELLATGRALGGPIVKKDGETKPLWDLLNASDLGPSSMQTYEETVTQLQRVFNGEALLGDYGGSISMVFAWPVIVTAEYNELLSQRRPEALVILAYYGVVLHRRRNAWAVGDAGAYLINSISEYLGKHWDHWLAWPKSATSATPSASTTNTPG